MMAMVMIVVVITKYGDGDGDGDDELVTKMMTCRGSSGSRAVRRGV